MPPVALKVVPSSWTSPLAAKADLSNAKGVLTPVVQGTPWSVSYYTNDHADSITEGCCRINEVLDTGGDVC